MDETYITKAIVLNKESFRENDSRVIIYSQDRGRLDLIARGTKKVLSKLSGHVEPISLTDIMVVKGRKFDYIGGAIARESYNNIKDDLDKLEAAGRGLRLFNKLIKPEQAEEAIFKFLSDYLNILNFSRVNLDYELLYYFFTILFLSKLGYQPELFNCIKCKKSINSRNTVFNYAQGGLMCANCFKAKHNLTISKNCVKVLQFAVKNDLGKLIKLKISAPTKAEIIKTISSFYQYNFL